MLPTPFQITFTLQKLSIRFVSSNVVVKIAFNSRFNLLSHFMVTGFQIFEYLRVIELVGNGPGYRLKLSSGGKVSSFQQPSS